MTKILTIADGFGDSFVHETWYSDFFKWPDIIRLLTKNTNVINFSRYGAGNEYIVQSLRHHIADTVDVALIQWATPTRLDMLLDDNDLFWKTEIANDPIYHNNVVDVGTNRYWLSSGSKNQYIQHYHQIYISQRQHQLRSQLYIDYAKLLLLHNNINYKFLLTWDSDYLKETESDLTHWCWHDAFKGMESFRHVSKFADLDFNLVQPISLIQFDFVVNYIMPMLDLPWRSTVEIAAVENMLHRKHKLAVKLKPND